MTATQRGPHHVQFVPEPQTGQQRVGVELLLGNPRAVFHVERVLILILLRVEVRPDRIGPGSEPRVPAFLVAVEEEGAEAPRIGVAGDVHEEPRVELQDRGELGADLVHTIEELYEDRTELFVPQGVLGMVAQPGTEGMAEHREVFLDQHFESLTAFCAVGYLDGSIVFVEEQLREAGKFGGSVPSVAAMQKHSVSSLSPTIHPKPKYTNCADDGVGPADDVRQVLQPARLVQKFQPLPAHQHPILRYGASY